MASPLLPCITTPPSSSTSSSSSSSEEEIARGMSPCTPRHAHPCTPRHHHHPNRSYCNNDTLLTACQSLYSGGTTAAAAAAESYLLSLFSLTPAGPGPGPPPPPLPTSPPSPTSNNINTTTTAITQDADRVVSLIASLLSRNDHHHPINIFLHTYLISLLKDQLFSKHLSLLTPHHKISLRSALLTFLFHAAINATLPPAILSGYATALAKLWKCTFTEMDQFATLSPDLMTSFFTLSLSSPKGLDHSPTSSTMTTATFISHEEMHRHAVGLTILIHLVREMNDPISPNPHNPSGNRKIAVQFKNNLLAQVFELAISSLKRSLNDSSPSPPPSPTSHDLGDTIRPLRKLQEQSLILFRECLLFDFIGTNPDDASEDVTFIQIPQVWKKIFVHGQVTLDNDLLSTLIRCVSTFHHANVGMCIECLGLLLSIRKSFFTDAERGGILRWTLERSVTLFHISRSVGDGDHQMSIIHECCRLLSRMRNLFQVSEYLTMPEFEGWLQVIGDWTNDLLFFPETVTSSSRTPYTLDTNFIPFLLSIWGKIASHFITVNTSDFKSPSAHAKITTICTSVLHTLLNFVMRNVVTAFAECETEEVESPMLMSPINSNIQDVELAAESLLEAVAPLWRLQHATHCSSLILQVDQLLQSFQEAFSLRNLAAMQHAASSLTFWTLCCGAVVSSRVPYQTPDTQDEQDGSLCATVLKVTLFCQTMEGGGNAVIEPTFSHPLVRIKVATLYFWSQFRKSYLADGSRHSKVWDPLVPYEVFDQEKALELVIRTIIENLKMPALSVRLLHHSLVLWEEFVGYSVLRIVRKLQVVQDLFSQGRHYTEFPFLHQQHRDFKSLRRQYFTCIARLYFSAEDLTESDFVRFMDPLARKLEVLHSLNPPSQAMSLELDFMFRDLFAILSMITGKKYYIFFFDWFGAYAGVMVNACRANLCTSSVLKFATELTFNSSSRMNFEYSSPKGILIFKQVCEILSLAGICYLSPSIPGEDPSSRYKIYTQCFLMLRNCISGRYVNFSVFGLYSDPCFSDACRTVFSMALSIPLNDLLAYPKVGAAFFSLIEALSCEQLFRISCLDDQIVLFILNSCSECLMHFDRPVSIDACGVLENLASFVYTQRRHGPYRSVYNVTLPNMMEILDQHLPEVIPLLLRRFCEIVLTEDLPNLWSYSRPLLPLILLRPDVMESLVNGILASQGSAEARDILIKSFGTLMSEVEDNLCPANRDRFTQKLLNLKRELNSAQVFIALPT